MKELKLYEAPKLIEQLINDVDEDGCITETALGKLDKLNLAVEAKGIGFIITRLEGYEATIDNEIKRLQNLKKSYKINRENLKKLFMI